MVVNLFIKGEWVNVQERQLLYSQFASSLIRHQLLKKRICSSRSKFFSPRVDPILGRLRPPSKQTGRLENCLPLKTWRKKVLGYPKTLNIRLDFKDAKMIMTDMIPLRAYQFTLFFKFSDILFI